MYIRISYFAQLFISNIQKLFDFIFEGPIFTISTVAEENEGNKEETEGNTEETEGNTEETEGGDEDASCEALFLIDVDQPLSSEDDLRAMKDFATQMVDGLPEKVSYFYLENEYCIFSSL